MQLWDTWPKYLSEKKQYIFIAHWHFNAGYLALEAHFSSVDAVCRFYAGPEVSKAFQGQGMSGEAVAVKLQRQGRTYSSGQLASVLRLI